ncbi:SPFH domain-containing protein [Cellulomonas sp. NPDC089187]|uniref:flotillin family protein n=1 Tax=Cellulomonas sp. NPDC089187 TaxID=3154970 RepID=UPI00341CCD6E
MSSLIVGIVALLAVVGLAVGAIVSRYRIPKANEALVITGGSGGDAPVKVSIGSGVFVVPFVQRSATLDLSATEVPMRVDEGVTSDKIKVTVDAVALTKIDGTPEGVRAAAQRFLGREEDVPGVVATVLAGALRAVIGNLSVEQVLADRAAFATEIKLEAEKALSESGLRVDTLQINAIRSEPADYIENLGRPQAAQVRREAEIAEATNVQEAERAKAAARIAIAEANKDAALREAEFQKETDAARAEAEAVGPKVAAAQQAEITQAEQANAQQQVELTKLRLDSEVRAKADADLYDAQKRADAALYTAEKEAEAKAVAVRKAADADQQRLTAEGEGAAAAIRAQGDADAARIQAQGLAEAENLRAQGLADAEAAKARGLADAEAAKARGLADADAAKAHGLALAETTQAQGLAEAEAIRARGEAEARVKELLAEAFDRYGQAAVIDQVLATLPSMMREAAAPIGNVDSITVLGDAESASGLTKLATDLVTKVPAVVKAGTGLDITALLTGMLAPKPEDDIVLPQETAGSVEPTA